MGERSPLRELGIKYLVSPANTHVCDEGIKTAIMTRQPCVLTDARPEGLSLAHSPGGNTEVPYNYHGL